MPRAHQDGSRQIRIAVDSAHDAGQIGVQDGLDEQHEASGTQQLEESPTAAVDVGHPPADHSTPHAQH